MARTINTHITGPVVLGTGDTPLTITSSGAVTSTGAGVDGIDGPLGFAQVNNAGEISSSGGIGVSIYHNGFVTNSGSISGTSGVVLPGGADPGSVTNTASGTISGLSPGGAGVYIGSIDFNVVSNAGLISGGAYGVRMLSHGHVFNSGSIIGGERDGANGVGVYFRGFGGVVTNNAGGSISGNAFGVFATGSGTVANSGNITGQYGVALEGGGSVTNAAGASISGQTAGAFFIGGPGTLNNTGVTQATAATGSAGADLEGGGSVTNNAGGTIAGNAFGVFITGGSGTVTNSGMIHDDASIYTPSGVGVYLAGGGSVSNNSGVIIGQSEGVVSSGGVGTVNNSGVIQAVGASGVGVDLEGGGNVTNNAGASLTGYGFAVFVTGGGTVTNAGMIAGGVYFANSATNRLVVDPGAVFYGTVGGGSGTLELASGTGSIAGVDNNSFVNFQSLVVDPGATWTLNNNNTAPTVTDNGTVSIALSLDASTAIDPSSTGLFQIDGGATFEVGAATGSQTQMSFLGSSGSGSALVIDNAGSFGTNVGTTSYAGSQLQNFAAGDTIDIKNFAFAGTALNFNSSNGLLQISNGTQQASLNFQTSSLGSGAFHVAGDGASGIFITHA